MLDFPYSNNQAKYEALIIDLKILLELRTKSIKGRGDSLLIINGLADEYKYEHPTLNLYYQVAKNIIERFSDLIFF